LKHFDGLKEKLNKSLRAFWQKNDIELLCAQSTDTTAFSLSSFRISETVIEEFGSKSKFHEFIKNHSDSPSDAVKEFLELYQLHAITGYSLPIVYNFKNSKLMQEKIKFNASTHGRSSYDEDENHLQIIFETNLEGILSTFVDLRNQKGLYQDIKELHPNLKITTLELQLFQLSIYSNNEKDFLFVSYDKKYEIEYAIEILKTIEAISVFMYDSNSKYFKPYSAKISKKERIKIIEDAYIQVRSIQFAQKPTA
jgi:hypothetical protein